MANLDFSVSEWHGFGSVTQVCCGISVSNFMCMSLVAVGRSLTIVSYVAFKMAALWFWTMFNCSPPIAHCHPLLWGGGILVDHWSTISSLILISKESSISIVVLILSKYGQVLYLQLPCKDRVARKMFCREFGNSCKFLSIYKKIYLHRSDLKYEQIIEHLGFCTQNDVFLE